VAENTTLAPVPETERATARPNTLGPIVPMRAPARPPMTAPAMPSMAPRVARGDSTASAHGTPLLQDCLVAAPRTTATPARVASSAPRPAGAVPITYGRTRRVLEQEELRHQRALRIRLACGAVVLSLGAIFGPMLVHHWIDDSPAPVESPMADHPGH
jgi:cell division septation protein DedD